MLTVYEPPLYAASDEDEACLEDVLNIASDRKEHNAELGFYLSPVTDNVVIRVTIPRLGLYTPMEFEVCADDWRAIDSGLFPKV